HENVLHFLHLITLCSVFWPLDIKCLLSFFGFCSFTGGISREYVVIQEQKTWKQAQAYCRENHIDLATVQSEEDWVNLREVVQKITKMAWTGLYNDINSWRWSYQNQKIAFSTWGSGEPNNYGGYEACESNLNGENKARN
uniref:C-type lectin domain-containing protein n=1 Tax=Sinocyclocheilus anshuiensis TaxID=1608454 RepID=A0A671PED2_9TELE